MNMFEESKGFRGKFLPSLVAERETNHKSSFTIDFLSPEKNPVLGG